MLMSLTWNIQASGVGVNEACIDAFQRLKLKKNLKYILFNLNEHTTEIVVDKESESDNYEDFINDLPGAECRWAVYDFQFEKEGAGKRSKIVFIAW
jgi:cofilin